MNYPPLAFPLRFKVTGKPLVFKDIESYTQWLSRMDKETRRVMDETIRALVHMDINYTVSIGYRRIEYKVKGNSTRQIPAIPGDVIEFGPYKYILETDYRLRVLAYEAGSQGASVPTMRRTDAAKWVRDRMLADIKL